MILTMMLPNIPTNLLQATFYISTDVKRKLDVFYKFYYNNFSTNVVLNHFRIGNIFNVEDLIPETLECFVVYNCICPGCNVCYN